MATRGETALLRLPFSTPLSAVDRIRTELQKSRLLGMQFQVVLPHSFREFRSELIGIRLLLKAQHDIISESHHDHVDSVDSRHDGLTIKIK
jgi:hypothetical protein